MATLEAKTELKPREKPLNIGHLLDFSPNKLSETEYLIMETLTKSKFAMNTYQIYRTIAEKIIQETFNIKDTKAFNKSLAKKLSNSPFGFKTFLELKRLWANPKEFEKIATSFRDTFVIDIPSYRRIARTLDNLNELGWVMKREESTKKEGAYWFISDEIRMKLHP